MGKGLRQVKIINKNIFQKFEQLQRLVKFKRKNEMG